MPFLNEAGLKYVISKINVRSSETLPENATDGTIIINPKEDIKVMNIGSGSGGNITVDAFLSSSSKNPVQNRIIKDALDKKLDKNGTAANSLRVNNLTVETAVPPNAKFTDTVYTHPESHPASMITGLSAVAKTGDYNDLTNKPTVVKTVNNITPDINGNVDVAVSGGGGSTTIVIDPVLSNTSTNAIQNKAVYAALANKMDKTATVDKAQKDSLGNIISDTYAKKTDINGMVKSVNNVKPDSNGNVTIAFRGGGGSNITVDAELSATSTNPVQNKAIYNALLNKVGTDIFSGFALMGATSTIAWRQGSQAIGSINATNYSGTARAATCDDESNVITSTYATKTELNSCVKSVNNMTPDENGNVNITVAVPTVTDTKVTNTLATTTKAYITGTTDATTNTGTQVFDTEVYLDATAGTLVAKTFKTSTGIEIY